ncbi:MAG: hypothetical protein JJ992_15305, partial [Planctomycetes bacterium]|nr:hypothetical protein [Planctomycetota bacterium]
MRSVSTERFRAKSKRGSHLRRRLLLETLESRCVLASLGDVLTSDIFPTGDADDWFLAISEEELDAAGGSYIVAISLSESLLDNNAAFQPQATLYSSSGDQIGGLLTSGDKRTYELDEPGNYRVRVRDNDDSDTGRYALNVEGLNPVSADAIEISLGDVQTGVLDPGAVDAFTFTASSGDVVTIALAETDANASGYHPRAELYHSATGERIALSSASTGGTARELSSGRKYISPPLQRAGLYVVHVYDDNYSDVDDKGYAFTVEGLSPPSEDAIWIARGEALSGSIDVGEIDEYRLVGSVGDIVTLSLSNVQAGSSNRLWAELYAPSGAKVAKLTSSSGPDEVENGEKVVFRLPEPSSDTHPYVVQVYDNNYTDTEDYALAFEGVSPLSLDATPISVGDALPGTIDTMAEVDAYYFTVSAAELAEGGGTYRVRVALESETTVDYKPRAVVYSPSGSEIEDISEGQT